MDSSMDSSMDRVEFRQRELAGDEVDEVDDGDRRVLGALAASFAFGCLDRRVGGFHEPAAGQAALLAPAMRLRGAAMVSSR